MEFNELIEKRRSIRSYTADTVITEEQLRGIISAAQQAPSWKNSETGRYYIALSSEAMEKVKALLPEYNRNNCENAAAIIVSTYVSNRSGFERDGSPTNERGNEWGAYDLGLQNENLILAARDIGFDTLIMGLRDAGGLRVLLGIPKNENIMSVIAIGKRTADPDKPERRKLDDIMKIL